MLAALLKEIDLREGKQEWPVETIYFGGGTPSLLSIEEVNLVLEKVFNSFPVAANPEITLEANPDDISPHKLKGWKQAGINRFSIGVQSFRSADLEWMNRAHNAEQAIRSVWQVQEAGFTNFSIDLIFGLPGMNNRDWEVNIETAIDLRIPHLSCYALTVEPKTALQKMIEKKKVEGTDPDQQAGHYLLLMDRMEKAGYLHYEISSFCLTGMHSRHNRSYWENQPYFGFGPSAHSFDGRTRSWNIAHNKRYIDAIREGNRLFEAEQLTPVEQLNEYIMLSLRTAEGLNLEKVKTIWGGEVYQMLEKKAEPFIMKQWMIRSNQQLLLTRDGKLFADGIASTCFMDETIPDRKTLKIIS